MGQVKFDIGKSSAEAAKAEGGIIGYTGPVPPKDTYNVKITVLVLKNNRNNDPMITGVANINEPTSSKKSKYNGYGIWFNQNITEQGAGYVNQFLDAISGGDAKLRKGFWEKGVTVDKDAKEIAKGKPITRIGGLLRVPKDGLPAVLAAIPGEDLKGNDNLQVGSWLLPVNPEATDDVDEDDEDDVEVEDASDDDDEDFDDESSDDDADESDEEADEDDEAEDDEEDEEADDEPEEDEESEDERRAELAKMSRVEIVKIAKSLSIKTGRSKSEEDYINEIIEAEFNSDEEAPF